MSLESRMGGIDQVVLSGDYDRDVGAISLTLNSSVGVHSSYDLKFIDLYSKLDDMVGRIHNIERLDSLEGEVDELKEQRHALEKLFFKKLATLENNLITTIERQKAFAGKVILVGAFLQIILTSAIGTAIAYIMKG